MLLPRTVRFSAHLLSRRISSQKRDYVPNVTWNPSDRRILRKNTAIMHQPKTISMHNIRSKSYGSTSIVENPYKNNVLQCDTNITTNTVHQKKQKSSSNPQEWKRKAQTLLNFLKERNASIKKDLNASQATNSKRHKVYSILQINTILINLSKLQRGGVNVKAAELAQLILEEMEMYVDELEINQSLQTGKSKNVLAPNEITYNAVINCWAKSRGGKKAAQNAQRVYRGYKGRER